MEAKRTVLQTRNDVCVVPSLEELAEFCRVQSPANVTAMRKVSKDHLAKSLSWLIVQFEGPRLQFDEGMDPGGHPSRSVRVFIHLAQHVAKRAVKNVLGRHYSTLDYIVFVNHLIDLRNEAEDRIARGRFKKSEFYSKIVDLMRSTAGRAS